MSKAILVINKPNKCSECDLYYDNKDNKMSCYIDDYIKDCKGVCSLKPIPNKRKMPITKTFGTDFNKGQVVGWNDCIDEILGDTE